MPNFLDLPWQTDPKLACAYSAPPRLRTGRGLGQASAPIPGPIREKNPGNGVSPARVTPGGLRDGAMRGERKPQPKGRLLVDLSFAPCRE